MKGFTYERRREGVCLCGGVWGCEREREREHTSVIAGNKDRGKGMKSGEWF